MAAADAAVVRRRQHAGDARSGRAPGVDRSRRRVDNARRADRRRSDRPLGGRRRADGSVPRRRTSKPSLAARRCAARRVAGSWKRVPGRRIRQTRRGPIRGTDATVARTIVVGESAPR